MYFLLLLTLNDIEMDSGGPVVDPYDEQNPCIKCFRLENNWDDAELFYDDIDEIDKRCNALLDYGDVDWFDASQCAKLLKWIDDRLQRPAVPRYVELLSVLRDLCEKAVNLNTGVMIDL